MDTAEWYRVFAEREARGRSPLYEVLASGVADDAELLAFLEPVPERKRQPNLLLAAVAFLEGVQPDYEAFRSFVLGHARAVEQLLRTRSTQTNEAGRCAVLLPALAMLPGPLALLEVGTSAGLCLLPDRYGYDYGEGRRLGDLDSPCQLACRTVGSVPVPTAMPQVVWRAGIDLQPVDVMDDEAVRWLEACVWPGQPHRLARLRAAIAVARRDPPRVVAGDLLELTAAVAGEAPRDATLVIYHSAVLAYLTPPQRARFAELVGHLPAVWLSNEGPGVLPSLSRRVAEVDVQDPLHFVIARDGEQVLGYADPHGEWVEWHGEWVEWPEDEDG